MTEYSAFEGDQTEPAEAAEPEAPAEAVVPPGDAPFDAVDVPHTADERVDEVLAGLLGLAGAPVADHVAIYDAVHRGLRDCLADLEHTPNPANRPAQPNQASRPGQPAPGMRPSPSAFGR